MKLHMNTLGIDIGSTTVKIALLNKDGEIIFSDYQRHYANIQETLAAIIEKAYDEFGDLPVAPVITGSGGLTLSKYLNVPFVQEVVAVATSLKDYAPHTDVAIELGGEDAKIIYFTGGIDQRMNGICAGGTGSFIDQMATLLKTDASGLNEYAKNYKATKDHKILKAMFKDILSLDAQYCKLPVMYMVSVLSANSALVNEMQFDTFKRIITTATYD